MSERQRKNGKNPPTAKSVDDCQCQNQPPIFYIMWIIVKQKKPMKIITLFCCTIMEMTLCKIAVFQIPNHWLSPEPGKKSCIETSRKGVLILQKRGQNSSLYYWGDKNSITKKKNVHLGRGECAPEQLTSPNARCPKEWNRHWVKPKSWSGALCNETDFFSVRRERIKSTHFTSSTIFELIPDKVNSIIVVVD